MDGKEFEERSAAALARIETLAEENGLDYEWETGGVLQLESPSGTILIHPHRTMQEIWIAAHTGGFHFRWDGADWRGTRDDETLIARILKLTGGRGHPEFR